MKSGQETNALIYSISDKNNVLERNKDLFCWSSHSSGAGLIKSVCTDFRVHSDQSGHNSADLTMWTILGPLKLAVNAFGVGAYFHFSLAGHSGYCLVFNLLHELVQGTPGR